MADALADLAALAPKDVRARAALAPRLTRQARATRRGRVQQRRRSGWGMGRLMSVRFRTTTGR